MASLPNSKTVTYEEWLRMPEVCLRCDRILSQGILRPKHFPDVQIDIAGIWPD